MGYPSTYLETPDPATKNKKKKNGQAELVNKTFDGYFYIIFSTQKYPTNAK